MDSDSASRQKEAEVGARRAGERERGTGRQGFRLLGFSAFLVCARVETGVVVLLVGLGLRGMAGSNFIALGS